MLPRRDGSDRLLRFVPRLRFGRRSARRRTPAGALLPIRRPTGTLGPWIAITSWMRTSRRVPLNVTPVCGRRFGRAHGRHVHRALDIEERWNGTVRDEAHGVLIEQAVALHGADGPERSAAKILDVVALHDRRVRIEEEAPVREVAPEQRVGPLSRVVAELEKREPAVAGLLPDQAERVVLAEEFLRRVVRDTCRASP